MNYKQMKFTNEFRKAKSPNVAPKGFSIVFSCNLLNMLFADIVDAVDDDGTVPGPVVVYNTT